MGETDVTFRHLLRVAPQPILRLVFPHRRLEPAGPLDPSVDRTRPRTTDSLFLVKEGDLEAALHIEVERDWRKQIPRRLFEYASGAVMATDLPIASVVVLLRSGGQPPQGAATYRVPGIDGDAFMFRYHVVPLWQLDAHRMLAELGLAGAPFCVAMRGADEEFVQTLAETVIADRTLDEDDRETTIKLLYLVAAAILGQDTAKRIFHVESIIQDPGVQALIREWKDEGRAEGLAEGQAKEARSALYTVLAARSLAVTPDVRTRIDEERDVTRLESWLKAAATADAIGDVFRAG
jgi:hypothetical protein